MDKWIDKWINGHINGEWTDKWIDKWIDGLIIYRYIVGCIDGLTKKYKIISYKNVGR